MLLEYLSFILGCCFIVFSVILIVKKTPLQKANRLLGIIFFIMAGYNITYYLYQKVTFDQLKQLLAFYIPIDYIFYMLIGPALYYHIRLILNRPLNFKSYKTWGHGIPVIPAIVYIIYFATLPVSERVTRLIANFNKHSWQSNTLNALFYTQLIIYLVVCLQLIRNQMSISRQVKFNSVWIDILWHRNILLLSLALLIVTTPLAFWSNNDVVSFLIDVGIINILFIYIFIRSINTQIYQTETVKVTQKSRNKLNTMNDHDRHFANTLHQFMKNSKVFLNSGCTVQDVAIQMNVQPYFLSNFINTCLCKNFPDFINEYRIEEAKELLTADISRILTIEAIGLTCGFGSKSSFNAVFKKLTSTTPSQYQQAYR